LKSVVIFEILNLMSEIKKESFAYVEGALKTIAGAISSLYGLKEPRIISLAEGASFEVLPMGQRAAITLVSYLPYDVRHENDVRFPFLAHQRNDELSVSFSTRKLDLPLVCDERRWMAEAAASLLVFRAFANGN